MACQTQLIPENLPVGWRFHPSDEELLTHYLMPKWLNQPIYGSHVTAIDLSKYDPWDLLGNLRPVRLGYSDDEIGTKRFLVFHNPDATEFTITEYASTAELKSHIMNQSIRESDFRAFWFTRNQKILDWLLFDRSSILCLQDTLGDAGYVTFQLARTNNRGDAPKSRCSSRISNCEYSLVISS